MKYILRIVYSCFIFLTANLPVLTDRYIFPWWAVIFCAVFLFINIRPSEMNRRLPRKRLRMCANGCELLILFLISAAASALFLLLMIPDLFADNKLLWFLDLLAVVVVEAVVFWNGIIRVYCTSAQIGVKWRAVGVICGWIPIANLVVLSKIIRLASGETAFEAMKIRNNEMRKAERLCDTRYPILMVHGVFFRDFKYFNYWGRIPKELEENGARIYYGNHQSAASVEDSAKELSERILRIIEESGSEKINVIAHSKGGLDCRYAISMLGMDQYIATLTTVNTPHRGCVFADYLLSSVPQAMKQKIAGGYNMALKKMGDKNPDFIAAVSDLTASACRDFNEKVEDSPDVYYQSVGSKLNIAMGGRFPLNFSYQLVRYFDGANDGLVAESSFPWGQKFTFLTTEGKRGISHADMIDLNRENIKDFDVREFYVGVVRELKEMGY